MRYVISFFFFTISLFSFDYSLKAYKIIEGVHCFFGLPSEVSYINGGNMVNSCYVETKDGYIVIDSGPTYQYAQTSYSIMEKLKKLPVKYVINTSSDEVHILGNDFYKEQGALLWGPKNYKRHFIGKKELTLKTKLSKDAFLNTRLIPLDKYLKSDSKLILGDMTFDIKLIKDDSDHLVVFLPEKKILFSGDMIFNNRIVPLQEKRSIRIWKNALKELKRLDWKDTVSAHGLMTRRSAFKNTESYLALLESEVQESLKNNLSRKEAIEQIGLSSFSEDRLYSLWHPQNVASVYDELRSSYNPKKNIPSSPKLEKKYKKRVVKKKKQHSKVEVKVHNINYVSFRQAMRQARRDKKIILLKIRSTTCKYCDKLDKILSKNSKVKKILQKYFKVVKLNSDYDAIPLNLNIQSTPTLVFVNPQNKKNLMQIAGIRALGELIEILEEAIDDGHTGGYLKK